MSATAIAVLNWKPVTAGALLGFCDAQLPSGMILHEIVIMRGKGGEFWASAPSKPMLDRSGCVMLDGAGKRRYTPVVSFADNETRKRFSEAVLEALRRSNPEALPPPAAPETAAWETVDDRPY